MASGSFAAPAVFSPADACSAPLVEITLDKGVFGRFVRFTAVNFHGGTGAGLNYMGFEVETENVVMGKGSLCIM